MNLDVRIKTTSEGQGAQQAADGLKKAADNADLLKAKLAQAAQTNASLTAESDKVTKSARQSAEVFKEFFKAQEEQAKATEKYNQTVQAVAKSQDRWTISKRQAVDALRRLRDSIPGLGIVIDALRNPYAAAAAAIAGFILVVQRQIEKQNQLAKESADLGADLEALRLKLENQGAAFDDATGSAEQFRQALAGIKEEELGLDAQTRKEIKKIDIDARRERTIHEASFAQQEAELELAVERGEITPEEARARRRVLKAGLNENLTQIDQAALDQKAQVTANAAARKEEQARRNLEALPRAEAEAQAAAESLSRNRAVRENNIVLAQAEQEKSKKEIATAEQQIANRSIVGIENQIEKQFRLQRLSQSQQNLEEARNSLRNAIASEQTQRDLLKGDELNAEQLRQRVEVLRSGTLGSKRSAIQFREQSTGFSGELAAQTIEANSTAAMAAATERLERQRDEQRILAERQRMAQEEIVRTLRDMRIELDKNSQQLKSMQGR